MVIRVRHFFLKILILRAFYSIRQGITKLFFFSETYISRIFWLQSLGSPVVKFKNFFFKYSLVTVLKTRIKSLNTNIESFCKNLKKLTAQLVKKLTIRKFSKKHGFSHVNWSFSEIFQNWFYIWVQSSNTRLLICQTTIFEQNISKPLLSQNIREIYVWDK